MAGLRLGWVLLLGTMAFACVGVERAPRSNGMGRHSEVDIQPLGLHQVEGRIKAVDPEAGTITVERQRDEELRLFTDPGTTIYIAGTMAGFEELEEGAPIRASFENGGPGNVARWIEIPRDEEPPPRPPDPPAQSPSNSVLPPESPRVNPPPGGAAP